jgi:hypothetical protein
MYLRSALTRTSRSPQRTHTHVHSFACTRTHTHSHTYIYTLTHSLGRDSGLALYEVARVKITTRAILFAQFSAHRHMPNTLLVVSQDEETKSATFGQVCMHACECDRERVCLCVCVKYKSYVSLSFSLFLLFTTPHCTTHTSHNTYTLSCTSSTGATAQTSSVWTWSPS